MHAKIYKGLFTNKKFNSFSSEFPAVKIYVIYLSRLIRTSFPISEYIWDHKVGNIQGKYNSLLTANYSFSD